MPKNGQRPEKEKFEGYIDEILPNAMYRVKLDDGRGILTHLAGKMKIHRIRVLAGDRVIVEMSEYDTDRGRIVRRL